MPRALISAAVAFGLVMTVAACTDPYSPGQRAVGGGLIGAGTGAAIGGLAGGGRGAAAGALIGGGIGAVGGAATTPTRPAPQYYAPQYEYAPQYAPSYAPPPQPGSYYQY